ITTGSIRPGSVFCVCALNALQNSMMFRPRWPSAGPMGGLGLALPAGTCSLMNPTIFFAMHFSWWVQTDALWRPPRLLRLFDLSEFQFHRRRPPENRHRHAQLRLVVIDVLDRAVEVGERPFPHPHGLADLEQHLGLGLLHAFLQCAPPTKPVTLGVFFTRCQASSVMSISTST